MTMSQCRDLLTGRRRWSTVAGLIVAFVAASWLIVVPQASATPLCEPYGSTGAGDYVVQNNRWGSSVAQCVEAIGAGFSLTQQGGTAPMGGAPLSYPSIYAGCHYGNCSGTKVLPAVISRLGSLRSTVGVNYVGYGIYDAAYDVWLDPTANKGGVNATEIMIWLHRQGPIQPIGSMSGSVNLGGGTWEVWTGNNGQNDVVSYVAPGSLGSFDADLMEFIRDTIGRGKASPEWFVNSVQFGFEPWWGGSGLSVTGFSVSA